MKKDQFIVERIFNANPTIAYELSGLSMSEFNKIYAEELERYKNMPKYRYEYQNPKIARHHDTIHKLLIKGYLKKDIALKLGVSYSSLCYYIRQNNELNKIKPIRRGLSELRNTKIRTEKG